MNSVQFRRHVYLTVFNMLKVLSFEGSFHLRKEENSTDKSGIVLKNLHAVLA
jgi:hypothetical protein